MRIHATCVSRGGHGVLLLGPPGAGKSDLALRLLDRDFSLVADDQVELDGRRARPVAPLAGLIEVRGLGVLAVAHDAEATVALALLLGDRPDRLPRPARAAIADVPSVAFDPWPASATLRVSLALDAALGARAFVAGAFAARDAT